MPVDPLAMAREPVMWTAVDGGGNCYSWREAERHRANLPTQGQCASVHTRATANGAAQGPGFKDLFSFQFFFTKNIILNF